MSCCSKLTSWCGSTPGSGAWVLGQEARPPQQAAAGKQSNHTEGRKLLGLQESKQGPLPPDMSHRGQPFPGSFLGSPPWMPGSCLYSLSGVGAEKAEMQRTRPGQASYRPILPVLSAGHGHAAILATCPALARMEC